MDKVFLQNVFLNEQNSKLIAWKMAEQVELSVYVFINQSINMLQTGFQAKLQLAASQLQSNSRAANEVSIVPKWVL